MFVVVPFLPEHQPALGVSSLSSVLASEGITADVLYLNIGFALEIGPELHRRIADSSPNMLLGEMLFTPALWGHDDAIWAEYRRRVLEMQGARHDGEHLVENVEQLLDGVAALRAQAPSIVARWADTVLARSPRIVGFTSTFQQNVASLALAAEIRRRTTRDEVTILFGGANCEGDMGRTLSELFPFIDCVVSGEGEAVIGDIARAVLNQGTGAAIPRILQGRVIDDLDALPVPDFDRYFETVKGTVFAASANLVAESSRGCWWGMKSHCTFCGLNGQTMQYRSKRPDRFADELRYLQDRYGPVYFAVADNILQMKYVDTLFPDLAATFSPIKLFYETKANLKKSQLRTLVAGGTARLQPGIESLSSSVLKLMAKGTSKLQNVQLLKWCAEFRIDVAWNLLYGFPGEEPEAYAEMARLIPLLVHLPLPTGAGPVRVDRFSPYWANPAQYGIEALRQGWPYDYVYAAVPSQSRMGLAYYFEASHPQMTGDDVSYVHEMLAAYDRWRSVNDRATLEIASADGQDAVLDHRRPEQPVTTHVTPLERDILRSLDSATTHDGCLEALRAHCDGTIDPRLVDEHIASFVERGWVITERNLLLSIVLDRSEIATAVSERVRYQLEGLRPSPRRAFAMA